MQKETYGMRCIAVFCVRLAARVARMFTEPGRSRWALSCYRLAGVVTKVCGGTLLSRVITFTLPEPASREAVESTAAALVRCLEENGVSVTVKRKTLNRCEANSNPDTWHLYPSGVSSGPEAVFVLEVFVPPYQYWMAGTAAQRFMENSDALSRLEC